MRALRRWGVPVVTASTLVFLALPVDRARIDRAVVLGATLAVYLRVLSSLGTATRPRPRWSERPVDPAPPGEHVVRLARLESALRYGAESGTQYDRSLRPLLRRLVDDRLLLSSGLTLAEDPVRCRDRMGPDLWQDVVAPHPSTSASAPGLPPTRVARLLDALERI